MIIATAGHVDHGKTALIKALTGSDTDRLPEEKKRGLTIDLGFAFLESPAKENPTIGFIDVPGHQQFINNMLAGIAAVDLALIVIAADDGPMPQTLEHISALEFSGVTRAIVVISKCDLVSESQLLATKEKTDKLLKKSAFTHSEVFSISTLSGQGIDQLRQHIFELATIDFPRNIDGDFRLAIDRSFHRDGSGLVVTGTAHEGKAQVGDSVQIMPAGLKARIRSIHQDGKKSLLATAGHRCALNLQGEKVTTKTAYRGSWVIANPDARTSSRFDVQLRIAASETKPIKHWSPVQLYLGASRFNARISIIEEALDEPSNQPVHAQLVLDKPSVVYWGDRFVLRDQSATRIIGGGTVLDPFPSPRAQRKKWRKIDRLAYALTNPVTALQTLINNHPEGYPLRDFLGGRNLGKEHKNDIVKTLESNNQIITGAKSLLAISHKDWTDLCQNVISIISEFHCRHRELLGCSSDYVFSQLPHRCNNALFLAAVKAVREKAAIKQKGHILYLPHHSVTMSDESQSLLKKIHKTMEHYPTCPPVVHDLAKELEVDIDKLATQLDYFSAMGHLVSIQGQRYYLPTLLSDIVSKMTALANSSGDAGFTASEFKDICNLGRRPAVQILEYFDGIGITFRQGNHRKVVNSGDNFFPQ